MGPRFRAYGAGDQTRVLRLWQATLGSTWPVRAGAFAKTVAELGGLVACAGEDAVAYVAWSRDLVGDKGSVVVVLVHPSWRRRGLGSRMLARASAQLAAAGAATLTLGRGRSYFWPGVPENLPDAAAFFARRGFAAGGQVADLVGHVRNFQAPAAVMERPEDVRFELADAGLLSRVVAMQRREFPHWARHYARSSPSNVLTAVNVDGAVIGSAMLEGPFGSDNPFLWSELIGGPVGALGCVGVIPQARTGGIGLALVARASELLASRGVRHCFVAYTHLADWYAQLGFHPWRSYDLASRPVIDPSR